MARSTYTVLVVAILFATTNISIAQNSLYIPDTLSGTIFNLNVQAGTKIFFAGKNTPTYGYNGNFLGPTLIMNKGDFITLNVTNKLNVATTVHWHGLHVAPENDGGPHQSIAPNTTWSPSFKMLNEAATFWYHPHGAGKTEMQVSKGLAGLIIIKDSAEANLVLPRRYGIDDFPLIVQSKAFDVLQQIAIATHEDSVMMVNGTINPYLKVPKQVVRFRLLNASADRSYYFGLSDNSNFYLIASDGGLLSKPLSASRVRLSPGERVEIIVDFNQYAIGQQVYLKSYASELPKGIIGADSVGTKDILIDEGYYANRLNGANFSILRFDVISSTVNPVTTIPNILINHIPYLEASANVTRTFKFTPDTVTSGQAGYANGPFYINKQSFNMDSINIITYLNNIEVWTLSNKTLVAHPFHIHDVPFYVLDINRNPPPPEYSGLKDVILVKPNDTVRFITKFTMFASNQIPYMYHCHLLHHEDDGMMGSFLVKDTTTTGIAGINQHNKKISIYPNPAQNQINILFKDDNPIAFAIYNAMGELKKQYSTISENQLSIEVSNWASGVYYLRTKKENVAFLITH